MNARASQVYVLRIWYEPSDKGEIWRASVSQGEERFYFAQPRDLAQFFSQRVEAQILQPTEAEE